MKDTYENPTHMDHTKPLLKQKRKKTNHPPGPHHLPKDAPSKLSKSASSASASSEDALPSTMGVRASMANFGSVKAGVKMRKGGECFFFFFFFFFSEVPALEGWIVWFLEFIDGLVQERLVSL